MYDVKREVSFLRKVACIQALLIVGFIIWYLFGKAPVPIPPQPLPDYPTGIDSSRLQQIEAYYLHQIDSLKKQVNSQKLPKQHEKTDYTKLPHSALLDSLHKYFCTDTLL